MTVVKRIRRRTPDEALEIAIARWFGRACEWCHGAGRYVVNEQWVTCKCSLPKESR